MTGVGEGGLLLFESLSMSQDVMTGSERKNVGSMAQRDR